jgi:hypothetical protein
MGVLTSCKLRKEVLKGDLEDAIFAADFGDLIARTAPPVYSDPKTFFQNTHPAQQLCKIIKTVFSRLADPQEGGAAIRLSTGFGGGKTHTLMALWHLARNITDLALGAELLPAAGRPKKVTVPAVDASKAGLPVFSTHDEVEIHSLWGELFYQLGGRKALTALGKADDAEASPSEKQIEAIFPAGPVLILLDELVIYMARLSERGQGNLLGFLNSLAAVVYKRPQTILVVTDPAGQAAYDKMAAKLADALPAAAARLDDMFNRELSDFDPIGGETARVIVRRLFEDVDSTAAQKASQIYFDLYERVLRDSPDVLPPNVASTAYAARILECYPFHPRLLDTAKDRLGALQDFQKSRGVLRLFARILRDIWESKQDSELITAGEINWSSPRIQADLLQRLNRDNFKAAVSADIEKHARELDGGAPQGIHQRVASALLIESLPMQLNSGMDAPDLTLAILRPEEAGPEPAEALDRLVGCCWHTYPLPGSRGWQFRYEANLIKQIEERKPLIPLDDAKSRVLAEVQGYFTGVGFKLAPWPENARQVPDVADLQLVLCEDEKTARAVCDFSDDSDPLAPIPRRFKNAILAVTASSSALNAAIDRAQRLLAADAIERENRSGDAAKLIRDQLQRLKPELSKQFRVQTCRAFDRVLLANGFAGSMEEKYQVPEDQMLKGAQGQQGLRSYLFDKKLMYRPDESLDVDLFLKEVLPGATPIPDAPGVCTAKAVHERFLGAPNLRLVPESSLVRQTIQKAVGAGKLVVKLSDGRAYDAEGCVEGILGKRRRTSGSLASFRLDDETFLTPASQPSAREWLKLDKEEEPGKLGLGGGFVSPISATPVPVGKVQATTWEKLIEFAETRPLLELELTVTTPASAAKLISLAQPMGADALTLSVSVSGSSKDGGSLNFSAAEVKPNNPVRPLVVAQTLFTAMAETPMYEAQLKLSFIGGRTGTSDQLRKMAEAAPEDLVVVGLLDKPAGANK